MIWLFKKIFGIAVTVAILFFALHLQIGGRPAKDYLMDAYHSPLVQEAVRRGKDAVLSYLKKDVTEGDASAPPMEHLEDDERKELEDVLKEKSN